MTRLFPESEAFRFEGRNVYARQVLDADDELRHSSTSDVGTVSASITVTTVAGFTVYHRILNILIHRELLLLLLLLLLF